MLDEIVTDLARAGAVGTNPEFGQTLARRAHALDAMTSTIFYADAVHLNIRLAGDKPVLRDYANPVNTFETVRRLTDWRLTGRSTPGQLSTAQTAFLAAYTVFEHDARSLAASRLNG